MKSIGLARLGRDAELRALPDGTSVCNLSLAVTVFDKNAEHNRGTQWIDATLWGKQAEALAQYLRKGTVHCFTLSDLKLENWESASGSGTKMTARVDNVELGPKQGDSGGQQEQRQAPAARPASNGTPQRGAQRPASTPAASKGFDDMDDDIPF